MRVICGGCNRILNVDDSLAGEFGRCPACHAVIKIPKPGAEILEIGSSRSRAAAAELGLISDAEQQVSSEGLELGEFDDGRLPEAEEEIAGELLSQQPEDEAAAALEGLDQRRELRSRAEVAARFGSWTVAGLFIGLVLGVMIGFGLGRLWRPGSVETAPNKPFATTGSQQRDGRQASIGEVVDPRSTEQAMRRELQKLDLAIKAAKLRVLDCTRRLLTAQNKLALAQDEPDPLERARLLRTYQRQLQQAETDKQQAELERARLVHRRDQLRLALARKIYLYRPEEARELALAVAGSQPADSAIAISARRLAEQIRPSVEQPPKQAVATEPNSPTGNSTTPTEPAKTSSASQQPPLTVQVGQLQSDVFATQDMYYPAPLGQVYLFIEVKLTAHDGQARVLKLGGSDDVILAAGGGKSFRCLGLRKRKYDHTEPAAVKAISFDADHPVRSELSLAFLVPEELKTAELRVAGAEPVKLSLAGISTAQRPVAGASLAGQWERLPYGVFRFRYDDPLANTIYNQNGPYVMDISADGERFRIEVAELSITGTAKPLANGYYQLTLSDGERQTKGTIRLLRQGKLLILYLRNEPRYQFTFLRKGEKLFEQPRS